MIEISQLKVMASYCVLTETAYDLRQPGVGSTGSNQLLRTEQLSLRRAVLGNISVISSRFNLLSDILMISTRTGYSSDSKNTTRPRLSDHLYTPLRLRVNPTQDET